MKLRHTWGNFSKSINLLIEKISLLEKKKNEIQSEEDLEFIQTQFLNWKNDVFNYLKSSFSNGWNEIAYRFHNSNPSSFNFNFQKQSFEQKKKKIFDSISYNKYFLYDYLNIIKTLDAVLNPNEVLLNERSKFTVKEISYLVLSKLYELNNDNYNPIDLILKGNGISLNKNRIYELIILLKEEGLIKIFDKQNVYLTIKGKIYIEESKKRQKPDYSKVDDFALERVKKIDAIIANLDKLGLGQELIYDELIELKESSSDLNKKDFGQLAKGKIIDLSINQGLNEILKYIYKELTGQLLTLIN